MKIGCTIGRSLAALALLAAASGQAIACGEERQEVKVGTDRDVDRVDPSPVINTIFNLGQLPAPINPNVRRNSRYAPTELTVYRVAGWVRLVRPEKDGDYHIVVSDERGRTIVVESVDPDCARNSVFAEQITAVRNVLDGSFRQLPAYHLSRKAIVTGVAFFDKLHGQTGAAPNGIELHPILSIELEGQRVGLAHTPGAKATARPAVEPPTVEEIALAAIRPVSSYTRAVLTRPDGVPQQATAQCRDGSYSFSINHTNACSAHGGVDHWIP